ncbi:uncharacterized protein [Diadema setosum]|uniref:uncharacterized protein n=1 Tax=Diadema setosum TaxID=31175 RepID=UPI003B3A2DAE
MTHPPSPLLDMSHCLGLPRAAAVFEEDGARGRRKWGSQGAVMCQKNILEPRSPTLPQSRQQHSPHTLFTPSSSTYDEDFPSLEQNTTTTKTHSKQHKRTVFRQPDVPSPLKVQRRQDVRSRHVDPKKCVATNRNGRIVVNLQESKMKNEVDQPPAFDRDSHHFEQGYVHSENRPPNDAEEDTPHKRNTSSEKCQNNVCKAMQEVKAERDSEQENPPNTEKDDPYQRSKTTLEKSQNIVGEPVLGEKDHDFEEKNPANVEGDILHGISKNASGKSQNSVGQPMPEEKAGHDSQQENPSNAQEDSPHVKLEKTFEESQINVDESVQGQKTDHHFEEANLQHVEEGETAQQKNEENCGRSENCVGEPIPGKKADRNSEQGNSPNVNKGDTQQRCKSTLVTNIDEIVEMKFLDFLGHSVAMAHVFGEQYISCDIFRTADFDILKHGYTLIDEILSEYYCGEHPAFLLRGKKRAWILKDALMTVLRQSKSRRNKKRRRLLLHELMDMESNQEQSHDLNYKEDSNTVQCAKASESQEHTNRTEEQDLTSDSGVMEYFSLFGKKVPCYFQAESVWLKVSAIFQYVGFMAHIRKRGWKFVCECLKANGIDSQSVFDNPKKRSHTTFPALEILLEKFRVGDKQRKIQVLTELRAERDRLFATSLKTLHLQKSDISEKN